MTYRKINVKLYQDEQDAMEKFVKMEELDPQELLTVRLAVNHLLTHYQNEGK